MDTASLAITVEELRDQLRNFFDNHGGNYPFVVDIGKKRYFVRPQSRNTSVIIGEVFLQTSNEFADVVETINFLCHHWERSKAHVVLECNGALYNVSGAAMETQNWSQAAGWEKSVILQIVA
jgi:hypothetical protein